MASSSSNPYNFIAQCEQALRNIVAVLQEAGASPEHMVRMTWYVIDRTVYNARLRELGQVYRAGMGRHFPAMSCVQVAGLMEQRAKVEIEVTAVLPLLTGTLACGENEREIVFHCLDVGQPVVEQLTAEEKALVRVLDNSPGNG